jgi:hypothetical protein
MTFRMAFTNPEWWSPITSRTGQTAFAQVTQELGPEHFGLTVTDHDAQHLSTAVLGDPGSDHHSPGDNLVLDPRLAVGRVQIHVREPDVIKESGAERGQLSVQVLADPRDLALGDSGVRAEGLDQVVDRSRGHAMDVCLHDHRVQGLVDPAPPLQQLGEEAPCPQLGDRQVQVAGLGAQRLVPVPVAERGTGVGVLVPLRADLRCDLGLDQLLQHPLGYRADQFEAVC